MAASMSFGLVRRGWSAPDDLVGRRIVAVEFESAEPIDVPGLLRLMPMQAGDRLRRQDLEEARWRLRQKNVFTSIVVDTEPRGSDVAVVIRVKRQAIVDRIVFRGNRAIATRELRRLVRIRENAPLTPALRDYSVRRITQRYDAEGFADAAVSVRVQTETPGEVDVIFDIDEGQPLRVGAVEVEGQLPIASNDVRRTIEIHAGDRYRRERQRDGTKAVVTLFRERRYYEVQVDSKWEVDADKTGTLTYHVDPGPLFEVEFSGNHHFDDEHLLGLLDLNKRPIVTDGTWHELERRIHAAYQEAGYYFAKVNLKIAPGPPKVVRFLVDEGRVYHVHEVRFEGNRGLSDGDLRDHMATRPPSWIPWRSGVLVDDMFDDDLKRLWYLYRKRGFESAEIVDARPEFDRERGRIDLTIVVEEGARTIVRKVEHAGLPPASARLPPPSFSVVAGKPLDPDQIESDKQALLALLAKAGYTTATVETHVATTRVSPEQIDAIVDFEVMPGPRRYVGTIIVQNNVDTHSSVLLRELPFRSGDPLDPSGLLKGQSEIYKLRLFRSVTVRPLQSERQAPPSIELREKPASLAAASTGSSGERTAPLTPEQRSAGEILQGQVGPAGGAPEPESKPGQVPVAVTVAEKPAGSLQYGGGYNTRDGFRGFAEVSDDNLQGLARRLSLRGELSLQPGSVSPDEYLGNLGFREPRLDDTKWAFRVNLIAQRSTRSVDQFSLERVAVIPAIERYFRPGLQAGLDLQAEQARIFDLAPDVEDFNPRDAGQLTTISLGPFMVYDGRDDAFVPHRGVFDSLRLRVAPGQFGSEIPFFKLLVQHAQYVPLADDLTFVYVGRAGYAVPFESGDIVPIRERFFLGGRTTVRGFSENSIGPVGPHRFNSRGQDLGGGDPLGGDLSLNLNTELRFPLFLGLGGVVFVDGGGVYLQDRSVSLDDFRRSVGLGLRYDTPVGPVSLDYGFKLDRRRDESVGEVHFSIGAVF